MLFLLTDSHQKLKLENIHDTLIILFDVLLNYKELAFLLKKTTTLQQVSDGNTPNLVLKRILVHFLKIPPLQKILHKKENFKPNIKPMMENFII